MTITVFKMSCFSSLWIQCADKTVSRACSRPLLMLHGVFITVCSLTSKLDGGPLADHGAIRVGGHTGVLSFVLVPDGVADDQVAIHHTVMVWFYFQINFDVIFQPTATEITGIKSRNWSLFLTLLDNNTANNTNLFQYRQWTKECPQVFFFYFFIHRHMSISKF